MTLITGTKAEIALEIARRDTLADREVALAQGMRLEDFQPKMSKIKTPV